MGHRTEYFIDREQEQAWLQDNLKLGRIVTVCGPGGMGKTALVAEVLWDLAPGNDPPGIFPDGIVFYSFYQQGVSISNPAFCTLSILLRGRG